MVRVMLCCFVATNNAGGSHVGSLRAALKLTRELN